MVDGHHSNPSSAVATRMMAGFLPTTFFYMMALPITSRRISDTLDYLAGI
jgi:hypothetical protein